MIEESIIYISEVFVLETILIAEDDPSPTPYAGQFAGAAIWLCGQAG
jgi:hypothetical protein